MSGVVACSALKHLYRHILKQGICDSDTHNPSATTNECAPAKSMLYKHNVIMPKRKTIAINVYTFATHDSDV